MVKVQKNATAPCVEQFEQEGNIYTKIAETEDLYLYEVDHGGGFHYELFEKGHKYKTYFANKNIKDGEDMYPKNEDFGRWAWGYNDKASAEKYMKRYTKRLR